MESQKIKILVVCKHEGILATLVRLVDKEENWLATACANEKIAIDSFKKEKFDLVLLGAGIEDEIFLKRELKSINPNVKIVDHYGGGSGLLQVEIKEALK
jgi:DNA-binding NarL/FixJ family response regulator